MAFEFCELKARACSFVEQRTEKHEMCRARNAVYCGIVSTRVALLALLALPLPAGCEEEPICARLADHTLELRESGSPSPELRQSEIDYCERLGRNLGEDAAREVYSCMLEAQTHREALACAGQVDATDSPTSEFEEMFGPVDPVADPSDVRESMRTPRGHSTRFD